MAIIGPGAVKQEQAAPKPALYGASEYEYVTILNPLTDDFQIQVAQDIPVNMPFQLRAPTASVQSERDVQMNYGFPLKNPEHQAKKFIYNTAIIPAGRTMNFKGNEAQVVVTQLINEILQREGKKRLMADPHLRKEVEDRIIVSRGSVQDILDSRLQTPQQQINSALDKSNEVRDEETAAFPGLVQENRVPITGTVDSTDSNREGEKPVGRPKKAN